MRPLDEVTIEAVCPPLLIVLMGCPTITGSGEAEVAAGAEVDGISSSIMSTESSEILNGNY
jgi:hypothetical protein